LPQDAVDGVATVVEANTPQTFDPSVGNSIKEGSAISPLPSAVPAVGEEQPSASSDPPLPPKDPLGELDPHQARDFTRAGIVNALYKAFLEGEKISKAKDAWSKISNDLSPYAKKVIDWLELFRGPGDSTP
jgi:hypothetical protein